MSNAFSDLTEAERRALLGPVRRLPRNVAFGLLTKGYLTSVQIEGTDLDPARFVYARTAKGDAFVASKTNV